MYYDPYFSQHGNLPIRQPQQLLVDMAKAVNDEFQAVQYYTKLADLAPNQQYRQAILGIRQDEIRHFYQFSRAYNRLSGNYSPLSLRVQLPSSFAVGVRDSYQEESDTVPFYRNIASQVSNQQMKRHFLRAAEDENRHAQYFAQIASMH
jgi:rubrerythrin